MAADEFFIYKFSREQAGLSGLAFDEGQFGVFGYVTAVRLRALLQPHPLSIGLDRMSDELEFGVFGCATAGRLRTPLQP